MGSGKKKVASHRILCSLCLISWTKFNESAKTSLGTYISEGTQYNINSLAFTWLTVYEDDFFFCLSTACVRGSDHLCLSGPGGYVYRKLLVNTLWGMERVCCYT